MRDEHSLDEPLLTDLLAELRSWGTGTRQSPPRPWSPCSTAPTPWTPSRCSPGGRRCYVAKLAGLGLAAKVALGAGVAAAAVTTAGATGVLPDAAQHGVASVVNAISPLEIPDVPAKISASVQAEVDPDLPIPTTTLPGLGGDQTDDDATDDATGDDEQFADHGACVSEVAKDKGLTGREHGQAATRPPVGLWQGRRRGPHLDHHHVDDLHHGPR